MAKLKIRKLVKEQIAREKKYNEVVTMLGLLVHKSGGEITFTQDELEALPEAGFLVNKEEEKFILKLDYKT